ncbi:MAG: hypothetical protein RLZZ301_1412 [Bacteroidota bacterium]|jgi:hypothetical protein
MKFFTTLFICIFCSLLNAQITTVTKPIKKTYSSRFYVESQRMQMGRTLVSNEAFLPIPLGIRAQESTLTLWSHQVGLSAGLTPHLFIDGAVAWQQNGESFQWKSSSSDSSFAYQIRYRYLAMPLQLKFQIHPKVPFYIGAGLVPALYQSYRQDLQWSDSLGAKYHDQIKEIEGMQSFILSYQLSGGIELPLKKNNMGLRIGGLYRQQLTSSYNPYSAYIHKSKGWGISFALTKKF